MTLRLNVQQWAGAAAIAAGAFFCAQPALAGTADNVSGWAWSGTIGWISMNCTNLGTCGTVNYGATITQNLTDTDRGDLSGWGWSETMGWICFGKTCGGTTPDGLAPYAQYRQTYNGFGDQIWGWAKVYNLGANGWVSLNCGNTPSLCAASNYYVALSPATGAFTKGLSNDHWAWGGMNDGTGIGWTDFSAVATTWAPSIVCPAPPAPQTGSCAPYTAYGRCEYDRNIACLCDSDAPSSCTGPRCPAPAIINGISPQHCADPWGLCASNGSVCFSDSQCPGPAGTCADHATSCRRDSDCTNAGVSPPCSGADWCTDLLFPWLQSVYGELFSQKSVTEQALPPTGAYNATFCITAKETIVNFNSSSCPQGPTGIVSPTTAYQLPNIQNSFTTTLGKLDIAGILAGRYGTVVSLLPDGSNLRTAPLSGQVYVVNGDLTINNPDTFFNAVDTDSKLPTSKGGGTIVVNGGNLYLNADMAYGGASITKLAQLASVGWIVLSNAPGDGKGNVYINKNVQNLVGAFYANGSGGIYTVAPPDTAGTNPLTVYGLMIAHKINFGRSYTALTQGAEQVIYDGRAVANPPPGFGDITKTLPTFRAGLSGQ